MALRPARGVPVGFAMAHQTQAKGADVLIRWMITNLTSMPHAPHHLPGMSFHKADGCAHASLSANLCPDGR